MGDRTLRTHETSDQRHFRPTKFIPKCPDTYIAYNLAINCRSGSERPDGRSVSRQFDTGYEVHGFGTEVSGNHVNLMALLTG